MKKDSLLFICKYTDFSTHCAFTHLYNFLTRGTALIQSYSWKESFWFLNPITCSESESKLKHFKQIADLCLNTSKIGEPITWLISSPIITLPLLGSCFLSFNCNLLSYNLNLIFCILESLSVWCPLQNIYLSHLFSSFKYIISSISCHSILLLVLVIIN